MRRLLILLPLTLASCWVDTSDYWVEANFEEEYDVAWCNWMLGCFKNASGWTSNEECVEAQQGSQQDLSQCTYDPVAAEGCVKAWWSLSCRAWDNGDFPEVCDEVYDCTAE